MLSKDFDIEKEMFVNGSALESIKRLNTKVG